ncbi:hypothetical protein [Sporosarcina sp. SAFN-010]|uniref:hypothetical protein n=1 Tax=Sporosarcina sp. SAFN-010 TaxID=3387273 RepID=UPI003F7F161B
MESKSNHTKIPGELLYQLSNLDFLSDFEKPGVYGLVLNEKEYLYIGKSDTSMFKRVWEHIGNLATKSEMLFGILPCELKSGKMRISIVIIDDNVDEKSSWKSKELKFINKYKPILQKQPNSDICIRGSKQRRKAILERVYPNKNETY